MKKRLMKLAALLMVLVLLPVCALAEAANAPEEQVHTIEKKTYPHLWCYSDKADAETSEGESERIPGRADSRRHNVLVGAEAVRDELEHLPVL